MVAQVGKTTKTLRNWDENGKLKPVRVEPTGYRYYSQEQLNRFLGLNQETKTKKIIGYCRVSSHKQKDDLARQIENVKTYMLAKGYQFEIITEFLGIMKSDRLNRELNKLYRVL